MSSEIKDLIRDIVGDMRVYSIACKVNTVNKTEKTIDCSPIDDTADLLEVKLIADNKTGFLIIPKVGSYVIVSLTNESDGYVSMFSEVEEIQLNGEILGGLIKIDDLQQQWNANILAMKTMFQTVFAAIDTSLTTAGGPAAAMSAYNPLAANIKDLDKNTLENKTVKHGNG